MLLYLTHLLVIVKYIGKSSRNDASVCIALSTAGDSERLSTTSLPTKITINNTTTTDALIHGGDRFKYSAQSDIHPVTHHGHHSTGLILSLTTN